MKYRNPRIAWSVVWGIATVLLTVLWARSYSSMQLWHFSRTHAAMVVDGTIMIDGAWVKTNRIAPYEPGAIINTWDHGPHYTYDRVGGLNIPCCLSVIVVICCRNLTLASLALLPPHSANRHNPRCRWPRASRVAATTELAVGVLTSVPAPN